jgi:DNA adenine methylase
VTTQNVTLAPPRARPFLKWAGGKTQLLAEILKHMPQTIGTYYEPFLGGGALFLSLAQTGMFTSAVVNDVNGELMNAWRTVRESVDDLIGNLRGKVDSPEEYERIRVQTYEELTVVEKAARTIYLNKTAFNGLYRVNRDGRFNVPFGSYESPKICDEPNLRLLSAVLNRLAVTFSEVDFVTACESAKNGDCVYFDPPYLPVSPTANFTSYTSRGFGLRDHERLAALFKLLVERGVHCIASNASSEVAKALYDGFEIHEVQARRNINSKGDRRGHVKEIIVVGRP